MKPTIDCSLYLVTDSALMSADTVEQSVEQTIKGGCTLVQLREKKKTTLDFYNTAVKVKAVCRNYGIPLIINDCVDIALAVEADGIHIGQEDLSAKIVRKLIGNDKILGVSASNLNEALQAEKDGADYIGVGAMFATGTKADAKSVSLDELKTIKNRIQLPIVVIGGINKNTIPLFADTGIDGVAVVSAVVSENDITSAARELKDLFWRTRTAKKLDFRAAIFDLDGTLINSMGVWEKIDIDFLSKRNLPVPDNYANEICALSFKEIAEYTIKRFQVEETVQDLINEWNSMAVYEYSHNVKLKPFAKEYLLKLKARGIKLGTATSLPKVLSEPVLKNNGIHDTYSESHTEEIQEIADGYLYNFEDAPVQ